MTLFKLFSWLLLFAVLVTTIVVGTPVIAAVALKRLLFR